MCRKAFWAVARIFSMLLLIPVGLSLAQEDALPSERVVFLLQNNQLARLDITSGVAETVTAEIKLLADATPGKAERRLYAAHLDKAAQTLYTVEVWGRNTDRRLYSLPTGSELVKIDLSTNARQIIFSENYPFNFFMSPDERRMVVVYYQGAFYSSRPQMCVLDLQTLFCQVLPFEFVGSSAFWINNHSFVIRTANINPLRLVDANTNASRTLVLPPEWYIYWAAPVPMTHSLIVSAVPREYTTGDTSSFLTFDLDTDRVQVLPYSAPQSYYGVNELQFSPEGHFLIYSGGSKKALIEYATGRLIQEFASVYTAEWLDNQTLLVQGSVSGETLEIFRFDALSAQITPLLSGEAAAGVLLVP